MTPFDLKCEQLACLGITPIKGQCCARDSDGDGNCDMHLAPGVLRIRPGYRQLLELVKALANAMEQSMTTGCTEHLDCWDDAEEIWYGPLNEARTLLKTA